MVPSSSIPGTPWISGTEIITQSRRYSGTERSRLLIRKSVRSGALSVTCFQADWRMTSQSRLCFHLDLDRRAAEEWFFRLGLRRRHGGAGPRIDPLLLQLPDGRGDLRSDIHARLSDPWPTSPRTAGSRRRTIARSTPRRAAREPCGGVRARPALPEGFTARPRRRVYTVRAEARIRPSPPSWNS